MQEQIIPRLIIRREKGDEELPILENEITIGRRRDCDVVINSPYASRLHATIRKEGERYLIIDQSRSGTYLQGERLEYPIYLVHDDQIRVEDTIIVFRDPNSTKVRSPDNKRIAGTTKAKLVVNSKTRQVFVDNQKLEISLSVHEFKLLDYLYENRSRACSREELIDAVWGEAWRGSYKEKQDAKNALYQLVHRLRQKLESGSRRSKYIKTVANYGYRLIINPKND